MMFFLYVAPVAKSGYFCIIHLFILSLLLSDIIRCPSPLQITLKSCLGSVEGIAFVVLDDGIAIDSVQLLCQLLYFAYVSHLLFL